MIRILLLLGLIAGLLFIGRALFRGRSLFVIRVRRGAIRVQGEIPGRRLPEVVEFIASLRLQDGALVRGRPDGRKFRLTFERVPAGLAQRIRNFLYLDP